ncbi:unnamed protein product [Leptosia nina]|uniref:Uncharacterized protein n=1 Tax=Leptosia nina TaxID=320188 RepID=A0AAV1J8I2_9NEOP
MPAVLREAGIFGAGEATPRGALPSRQPRLPRHLLLEILRASELCPQPHENQAQTTVGENENSQVELRLDELRFLMKDL